jgi:hypothetical protein
LVSADVAGPTARKTFFFSSAILLIARPVLDVVPPTSMSTAWVSNHSRALAGGHVGLVLVVGEQISTFLPLSLPGLAEVGHGHPHGLHAALAVDVGVQARHVGDDADLDDVAGDLGLRGPPSRVAAAASARGGGGF